jgi:hypothetical protein
MPGEFAFVTCPFVAKVSGWVTTGKIDKQLRAELLNGLVA